MTVWQVPPDIPAFAPLSLPEALHLLMGHRKRPYKHKATSPTVVEDVSLITTQYQSEWKALALVVQEKRSQVFSMMNDRVRVDRDYRFTTKKDRQCSPTWLRAMLTELAPQREEGTERMAGQNLSLWKEQGVLRYRDWGDLEEQSVAALLVARMIDKRARGWLPPEIDDHEPWWWCWRQDAPTAPVVPCPFPLPPDVPTSALLWTPWSGAAWEPNWLAVHDLGAIRWCGAEDNSQGGEPRWTVTEENLRRWSPEIISYGTGVLESAHDILNIVATLTLLRLAVTRLSPT